jgi:hypothetical protein
MNLYTIKANNKNMDLYNGSIFYLFTKEKKTKTDIQTSSRFDPYFNKHTTSSTETVLVFQEVFVNSSKIWLVMTVFRKNFNRNHIFDNALKHIYSIF